MRKVAGFVAVTVGTPLAALAIGAPAAWAAPSTGSSGNGASVSVNGTPHGSPNASGAISTPSIGSKPNVAVVVNSPGGEALACTSPCGSPGSGNKAILVNSPGAEALAFGGSNNTAIAVNSPLGGAIASNGSNNTARAINDRALSPTTINAKAVGGSSTATAINNSFAQAGPGSGSTATAKCGGSATAFSGQTVTSNGGSCGK